MEFKDIKEIIRQIFKKLPDPHEILLEGTSTIYLTYKKRKEMLKEKYYDDIFDGQSFIFKINNKFVYYSVVFGLSSTLDILGAILASKYPRSITLVGTCRLIEEIKHPTIVIPLYAETELLNLEGKADRTLVKTAKEISEKLGFNVIVSDKHLTKLSFLETFDKNKEEKALSIDMETSIVYYLANKYNIPAIAILGVSDYKTKEGKVRFVRYEYNLKDKVFEVGLNVIESLTSL